MKGLRHYAAVLHTITIDQALRALRRSISLRRVPAYATARRALLAASGAFGTVLKILAIFILALAAAAVSRSALLFFLILVPWSGIVVFRAYRRSTAKRKEGIAIGEAYRHMTGMDDSERASWQGGDGERIIDYLKEPNPHVFIIGSTSSGKTTTARALIGRVSLKYGIPFLVIDWSGENEAWAGETGAALWRVPAHFKVNLFMLNGLSREERVGVAIDDLTIAARLTPLQASAVKSALLRLYYNGMEPSLLDLWKSLKSGRNFKLLDQRLRAVQRVIGAEPPEFWDGIFKHSNVVSLKGLSDTEKLLASHSILRRIAELFDRDIVAGGPKLVVVIDEAWQLFKREKDHDKAKESVAEKIVRQGRKYGIAIVISTQQMDDVPKAFIDSCAIIMLHQQRDPSYFGRDVLQLGRFEREYAKHAAQGEMLLFERNESESVSTHPDYVRVEPLKDVELEALKGRSGKVSPAAITEPEMPLEMSELEQEKPREPQEQAPKRKMVKIPEDVPTPKQYAGLIAIYNSKESTLEEVVKYISSKGWFTSPSTLYGSKSSPGIAQQLLNRGMAKLSNGRYSLTETSLKWVDADMLMSNQPDKQGSEEHKRLMRRTIKRLQDSLILCVVSSEKHSFDILGIPINEKKRGLWDISQAKGYEIQTSARKDSIKMNNEKAQRWGVPMVWVSDDAEVLAKIEGQLY